MTTPRLKERFTSVPASWPDSLASDKKSHPDRVAFFMPQNLQDFWLR
jgi:hypothetical protein